MERTFTSLADLTRDPALQRFFRRGEDGAAQATEQPAPKPLAPAAREMALA